MSKARETVAGLRDAIAAGERKAVDVVQQCYARIDADNSALNCFRELYKDEAMAQAAAVDRAVATGESIGPLAGVPIAVKDNIVTEFGTTACGSRILENYQSPFTATAVERLQRAGAIIVGKTNCDEFAMGSSTEHCAFGSVKNPWSKSRVPGGSSGGSAAAVAAGLVPAALGSDTGGSVRQPAALCGIVGLKPSYGRVSRHGLVAYGSSFDQIGPLTNNVSDAAEILEVIAGTEDRDSTCADRHVPDYPQELNQSVHDLKIGLPKQYISKRNHPAVNFAIENAVAVFKKLGAEIIDIDLPLTEYGIATYYIIAPAEASSNLARYDGIRYGRRAKVGADDDLFELYAKSRSEGFGQEVQLRIMLGTYVLSAGYYDAYYKKALQARRLIKQEYDAAFAQCHAIIGPTSPTPAFRIGEKQDPVSMYLTDVYTTNTAIAGICGMSIPCGFANEDGESLPIGLQLQCQAFDELTMLQIARQFEAATTEFAAAPGL